MYNPNLHETHFRRSEQETPVNPEKKIPDYREFSAPADEN